MILTDAGPLVAIIDKCEPDHPRCVAALETIALPLVTTWPVFTEAMYLLGDAGGWAAQERLWRLRDRGDLELVDLPSSLVSRSSALMHKYHNVPMDLADATLVALAEARGWTHVFTLDSHFHAYRLSSRRRFTLLPA